MEPADRTERLRILQQVAGFARLDGVVEPPPWPTSSPEAEVLLTALIDCSLADGQASTTEYEAITAVAMLLGHLPRLQPLLTERRGRSAPRCG